MWVELGVWGLRVVAKVFPEASKSGLPELANVSKMTVKLGKKELLHFDRGMDYNYLPHWLYEHIVKVLGHAVAHMDMIVSQFM